MFPEFHISITAVAMLATILVAIWWQRRRDRQRIHGTLAERFPWVQAYAEVDQALRDADRSEPTPPKRGASRPAVLMYASTLSVVALTAVVLSTRTVDHTPPAAPQSDAEPRILPETATVSNSTVADNAGTPPSPTSAPTHPTSTAERTAPERVAQEERISPTEEAPTESTEEPTPSPPADRSPPTDPAPPGGTAPTPPDTSPTGGEKPDVDDPPSDLPAQTKRAEGRGVIAHALSVLRLS